MNAVKRGLLFLIRALGLDWILAIRSREGYLAQHGWFRSRSVRASVGADGRPIPWITYPATDFLSERIAPGFRVFEYGSGASTLWWASRVRDVVTCEHDAQWFQRIREQAPTNVTAIHVVLDYGGNYCRQAELAGGKFDLIMIDGRDRTNCLLRAPASLSARGVIVLDNAERPEYAQGIEQLKTLGFRALPFWGLSPGISDGTLTLILYRADNCLGI